MSENGDFENLRSSLESALSKIAEIYSCLLPEGGELQISLAIYDGVRQLADPYTEPSGKWVEKVGISEIYSPQTAALVSNLSAHIL